MVLPSAPAAPAAPVAPVDPVAPVAPAAPVAPVAPMAPAGPIKGTQWEVTGAGGWGDYTIFNHGTDERGSGGWTLLDDAHLTGNQTPHLLEARVVKVIPEDRLA